MTEDKHEGDRREYYISALFTAPDATDEIYFGLYSPDGGTSGEMCMRWYQLGAENAPRLEAYDDAWSALATMPDLIAELAKRDNWNITPAAFCEILIELGFTKHD